MTATMECIFCRIVAGKEKSFPIWEDADHLAFLTPFPNTPGFTVVISKTHYESYGFTVPEGVLLNLVRAARRVALQIDENLGVVRTALIMEGYGVNHLHVKLFPMHGIESQEWKPIHSSVRTFYEQYPGMIASHDGPRMGDEKLAEIATRIRTGK